MVYVVQLTEITSLMAAYLKSARILGLANSMTSKTGSFLSKGVV